MSQDNNGILWLCTSHGIFLFDPDKERVITKYSIENKDEFSFPANEIYHKHVDNQGDYWFGTDKGLLYWNQKTNEKTLFNRTSGLSDNTIYAVLEDDHNRLWLSSNYGIMSFDKTTFDVNTYTKKDGLIEEEFNRLSYFKSKDGTLFFGGLNGVTSFHPDRLTKSQKENIKPVVSDIEIIHKKANEATSYYSSYFENNEITFRPGDRFLKINYTIPTLTDKSKILYSWKLDGVYNDWTYQKENFVRWEQFPIGAN